MLTFNCPYCLLLLPLPWLVRLWSKAPEVKPTGALRVPFFHTVTALQTTSSVSAPHWPKMVLLSLIWFSCVISATQPVWQGEAIELPASGRDLMLSVDISESMKTPDFTLNGKDVNRLTAVKSVLDAFIERRQQDRIGLVLFGSQAYLQTPLTFDRKTVQQLLSEAQIGIAGPQTAIGDGIGLALKRLQSHASASRVLILLTDGANTAGAIDPLKAAELAAAADLKIYTIGVGSEQMQVSGPFGFSQRTINPSAELDETTLKAIAKTTQGQYFRAKDLKELDQIYRLIDELEPIEVDKELVQPQRSYFHWPLAFAILLSALGLFIYGRCPHD